MIVSRSVRKNRIVIIRHAIFSNMPIDINLSQTCGPNVEDFLNPQPKSSCFIPICLYSFMANRLFLQEYLPNVISRCLRAKILICDYLERHNIMAFNSLSEDAATEKAKIKGEKIAQIIADVLELSGYKNGVQYYSCRVDIERDKCRSIAQALRQFVGSNDRFKADLDEQVQLMINGTRRLSNLTSSSITSSMMNQLREYMIEEVALYLYHYQQGYTTEIYPGRDMKVLRKIASGQYAYFPYDFSERTHISVSVLLDSGMSYAQLDNNQSKGVYEE